MKKKIYKAFGLNLLSAIELPELLPLQHENLPIDITIEESNLLELWREQADEDEIFIVKKDIVIFRSPEVAIFYIKDGKEIKFHPLEKADEDQIRLYLLGTCMGAILMQRKILPLHGSAVEFEGKAYAIVGDSGAGKSTLASAILAKGYKLLSDDIIPVSISEEGTPVVTPSYPHQKLWLESLNQFGIESANFRPIIFRETKFSIPVHESFTTAVIPLAGVFELIRTEKSDITISPLKGLNRLHKLFYHTYRNSFIIPSQLMDWHFHITSQIANKILFYQINRPASRFTAQELTDLVLESTLKEEVTYDQEQKSFHTS